MMQQTLDSLRTLRDDLFYKCTSSREYIRSNLNRMTSAQFNEWSQLDKKMNMLSANVLLHKDNCNNQNYNLLINGNFEGSFYDEDTALRAGFEKYEFPFHIYVHTFINEK